MKRISKWLLTLVIVGFSTVSEITYTSPRVTATTDSIKSLLP